MRIAVFDAKNYDRHALEAANQSHRHQLQFFEPRLNLDTVSLVQGADAVCPFVNDRLDAAVVAKLAAAGVKLVTLRCAGYNGVDLAACRRHGIAVTRVPAYSPHAVAEHAFALLLAVVRRIHKSYTRVREMDFSLDGLVGFDLHGKTMGVLGAGRIGQATMSIARGFGMRVLAYDLYPKAELAASLGCEFVSLDEIWRQADVISLHLPLTAESRHLVNRETLARMKPGAVLINTSRGGLIDTAALLEALKAGRLSGVGLDVYEMEEGVFFENLSESGLQDDQLARLLTFPNVLVTSHQGFLTREALMNIADATLGNAGAFERGEALVNAVSA
ncbi:2-hydroxyacid dehydrogenase [Chromobacterium alkanivorans]|uniref:2-hydroxyacid dehydrogenase n=1 Tax=Chromobacterium TaxID=535 RepID=UPI000652ADBD|nr:MULTISPECIES: 2-hydroxyacid dehydrogenase [Chromobacterium]KMN83489.1 2-hydroxyacid dehydrogenase [Chromobacterium sp. LK11]MBN3005063.1 2-hydroxyacid dehydrogenase [Chromobacterium alkanivorans]